MSRRTLPGANRLLTKWQKELGLLGWEVRIAIGVPVDENCRSNVEIDTIHQRAAVRLDSETPASQLERQIVHELLHVLLSGTTDTLHQALRLRSRGEEATLLLAAWERAEERAIERLASTLTGTASEQWGAGETWNAAFPVTT